MIFFLLIFLLPGIFFGTTQSGCVQEAINFLVGLPRLQRHFRLCLGWVCPSGFCCSCLGTVLFFVGSRPALVVRYVVVFFTR